MLKFFKDLKQRKQNTRNLYRKCVHRARQTVFYEKMGVPDSLDGRYEMILLHVFLVIHRLKGTKQGGKQGQALFDVMYRDMASSLREIGIGDLSVPKHMKRMMNGFNGRVINYENALDDPAALKEVIRRNVYGTLDHIDENMLTIMVKYIQDEVQALDQIPEQDFTRIDDSMTLFTVSLD